MRGRGGYRRFEPHTRPQTASFGNRGTPIKLVANYFKLMVNPNIVVYQYHVTFEPSEVDRRFKRRTIYAHKELFNEIYIYDGETTIFSLNDAGADNNFVDQLPECTLQVNIKRAREIQDKDVREGVEMVRVYNTQMRKFLSKYLKMIQIRQFLYSPQQKINIQQHNISVWPGTLTAINHHFGGVLLCCDPIFKVVRTDNALDFLKKVRNEYKENFKDEALKQLVSSVIMTSYNNRTYRIDDIEWKAKPTHNMPGDEKTYIDYYRERYQIVIRDVNQPLLVAKSSIRDQLRAMRRTQEEHTPRPVLLVPELCIMTGLSDKMRANMDLMKSMAEYTRPPPAQRVQTIRRFINELTRNQDVQREMNAWGTQYNPSLVQVDARVLPFEAVLGRDEAPDKAYRYDHSKDDFIAQIRSKPLRSSKAINNWVIIATERDRENVDKLAQTMRKVCQSMAIDLRRPLVRLLPNPQTRSFVEEGRKIDAKNTDIVVVICPDDRADRYCALKKLFCCDLPVLSQVVLARNVRKPSFMSICTKVAIQIACKMGSEAWCMDIPAKGIMVVGFDTYHETQLENGARKSVGGFVCSINPSLSRWYSRVNFHNTAEELSNHFTGNMKAALNRYLTANQRLPDWIVVYRDGVGEGQIAQVLETEVKDITKAISSASANIQFTFIIVSKRINTRLYRPGPNEQYANPPPGTVVDTVISRPSRFDFYLVSQSVRQGTVTPTYYNIIRDTSAKSANIHQMLAYKMTHMYYNWPGTIRVPAPCQYAHKLAFLTGTALRREPNIQLADYLFYL
ncbi:piwi-like protein 1 [Dinothrombium tinctorium]|uniref:Piwi-like protein 1 n=1 Tax=Dinothrombium tinctorium TaxID=1965070 RepID=A0A3S3PD82_9ACAR|nr:piwi-like protein 1 [Dinothrombium tinctorium]